MIRKTVMYRSTPEGFGRILESGKLFSLCPEIVIDALEILNEMGIN